MSGSLAYGRARTGSSSILAPEAFLAQPIALRHPFIFYVGHLPAFAWNHVCVGVLARPSFNAAFDELFSRGIDPDVDDPSHCHAHPEIPDRWPTVAEVLAYRDRVRASVLESVDAVTGRVVVHHGPDGARLLDGDRARAHAPGDAPLYAPGARSRPEGPSRLAPARCRRAAADPRPRCRCPRGRRRSARRSPTWHSAGTMNSPRRRSRAGFPHRRNAGDERSVSRLRRRRRIPAPRALGCR